MSLLCQYGGIGSKSRHGFGSLSWDGAWDLQICQAKAKAFLQKVYPNIHLSERQKAYSWETAIQASVVVPLSNAWTAIDRLGLAMKAFASRNKHRDEKAVLGLPRKIHGPNFTPIPGRQTRETHRPPKQLEMQGIQEKTTRFASPVWYHLDYQDSGHIVINMTAFPSSLARSEKISREMLDSLLIFIKSELEKTRPVKTNGVIPSVSRSRPKSPVVNVKVGEKVKVILLEEKTKKGGWKVRHTELGVGPIMNTADVPADKNAGDEIVVEVAIAKQGAAQFKWP